MPTLLLRSIRPDQQQEKKTIASSSKVTHHELKREMYKFTCCECIPISTYREICIYIRRYKCGKDQRNECREGGWLRGRSLLYIAALMEGGASFLSFISNCYGGYHRNSLAPCEKRRPALFFQRLFLPVVLCLFLL